MAMTIRCCHGCQYEKAISGRVCSEEQLKETEQSSVTVDGAISVRDVPDMGSKVIHEESTGQHVYNY